MSAATLAEQADAMRAALGDGQPATDALLVEFAEQIRDRRAHDHASAGPDWDWYCLNASGWLGDKSLAVLRRLLDAEAEVERLRTERDQFADRVDTLTSVARSNKQAYAEAVATVARLEQERVQRERIANAERERVAELEQQLATARADALREAADGFEEDAARAAATEPRRKEILCGVAYLLRVRAEGGERS